MKLTPAQAQAFKKLQLAAEEYAKAMELEFGELTLSLQAGKMLRLNAHQSFLSAEVTRTAGT